MKVHCVFMPDLVTFWVQYFIESTCWLVVFINGKSCFVKQRNAFKYVCDTTFGRQDLLSAFKIEYLCLHCISRFKGLCQRPVKFMRASPLCYDEHAGSYMEAQSISAICGRWFDFQWSRSRYTLLMRPNKVETAVQCFRISCVGVHRIFWSW